MTVLHQTDSLAVLAPVTPDHDSDTSDRVGTVPECVQARKAGDSAGKSRGFNIRRNYRKARNASEKEIQSLLVDYMAAEEAGDVDGAREILATLEALRPC